MFRYAFFLLAAVPFSYAQTLPSLRWVQQIDNSGTDTFAGIGTDAQGNIYVAGSTTSPNLTVKAARQPNLGSAGIYRIDGPGSAYTRLGLATLISALAVDPSNSNVFYGISSGKGVKRVDGGNTWTSLSLPSNQLLQFAVDPKNDQVVYAVAFDTGFYKSTDAGATWNAINNGLTPCTDCSLPTGYFGARQVWIDPNTSVLFIYFGPLLERSSDGGASWQEIGPVSNGFGVYFETSKPDVVYVFSSNYGPLKSTDDGQTFQGVSIPVNSIFADPNHPGRLLGNGSGGVFESDDDGATWALQLKISGGVVAADWTDGFVYASTQPYGIVQISSDLKTVTPIGPSTVTAQSLVISNGHIYVPNTGGHNAFVTKFDPSGTVIYSTYFGGSGDDPATAMAVDPAGNVYVTGVGSSDFPTTKGAYATSGSVFLFKLNPDGTLSYSTYFPSVGTTSAAIAVDPSGSAFITGTVNGTVPTTPGAYQSKCACGAIPTGFFTFFQTDAFLAKFDPTGSSLVYSTYLGVPMAAGKAVALGSDGSAYLGSVTNIYHLNASGSSLLGTVATINVGAMTVALDGSVYVGGSVNGNQTNTFQPTAGAFQTNGPPTLLPYQGSVAGAIVKLDPQIKNVLAATYYGGPYGPAVNAMTADASGNVYIGGGTAPHGVPTRTVLFEAFGPVATGYLSEFSSDLSTLLFSTYLGDAEVFSVQGIAASSNGSVVIGGSTATAYQAGNVYLNSLTLAPPPALRIDSILNAASLLDGPLSVGETIVVRGAGFASNAQLLIGGSVVQTLSITPTQITAAVPSNLPMAPTTVQVRSNGAASNVVVGPVAAASPGVFSANGTGLGQGYILNQDGTLNTSSNPASPGQQITINATGVGPVSFTNGYAVTQYPVNVFVGNFYCNGVAAVMGPVMGLPGSVYQITVIIPTLASLVANNPDLKNFTFPPLDSVVLQIAGATSQIALAISITP